ncbi:MAG TPA: carboxypeptidase-like regulatory domain-containing protein, partial [Acidobacteriota bacterium]|nr:carboxypeptidase-like regulatory domain-containing protein [Acidobacteriota bacterium]
MYQKLQGNTITKVLTGLVFTLGLVFLLSNAPATLAQGTNGRLVVTVKDQTEAVVAGATIKVVNQGTSQEITGTTNDSGVSIFPQMAVGLYTVKVEVPGFKTAAREDLKIDVGQEYGIVISLEVGSEGDVVTVTAGEELVQTTTSEVRNTVSEKQVQELPINGRDPLQLIQLQAGVNSG